MENTRNDTHTQKLIWISLIIFYGNFNRTIIIKSKPCLVTLVLGQRVYLVSALLCVCLWFSVDLFVSACVCVQYCSFVSELSAVIVSTRHASVSRLSKAICGERNKLVTLWAARKWGYLRRSIRLIGFIKREKTAAKNKAEPPRPQNSGERENKSASESPNQLPGDWTATAAKL